MAASSTQTTMREFRGDYTELAEVGQCPRCARRWVEEFRQRCHEEARAIPAALPEARGIVVEAPFTVVNPATGKPILSIVADAEGACLWMHSEKTGQYLIGLHTDEEGASIAINDLRGNLAVMLDGTAKGGILQVRSGNPGQEYHDDRSCIAGPLDILNSAGDTAIRFEPGEDGNPSISIHHPDDSEPRINLGLLGDEGCGSLHMGEDGHNKNLVQFANRKR